MHAHVIHNNRLLKRERLRLPSLTAATLEGRGVFTTLAVYQRRPFMWPEHWWRLREHADRAGVDRSGFDEDAAGAALARLIEANDVTKGRARVLLLARGAWETEKESAQESAAATDLLMLTDDALDFPTDGLALTVSPQRANTHSLLAGVKSINYLEHVLALEEAHARDFDEAVVLNERGEVVSATTANIFWVTNGTLHTPALSTGAVSGTTRARVVEIAGEMALPHVEGVYDLAHLGEADEIFLTSSSHGVAIVTTFDFHRYTVPLGSVALHIREAFRQLTIHTD